MCTLLLYTVNIHTLCITSTVYTIHGPPEDSVYYTHIIDSVYYTQPPEAAGATGNDTTLPLFQHTARITQHHLSRHHLRLCLCLCLCSNTMLESLKIILAVIIFVPIILSHYDSTIGHDSQVSSVQMCLKVSQGVLGGESGVQQPPEAGGHGQGWVQAR